MFWYWHFGATLIIKCAVDGVVCSKRKSTFRVPVMHCVRGQTCVVLFIMTVAKVVEEREREYALRQKLLASFVCLTLALTPAAAASRYSSLSTLAPDPLKPNAPSLAASNLILISWRLLSYTAPQLSLLPLLALLWTISGRNDNPGVKGSFLIHFFLPSSLCFLGSSSSSLWAPSLTWRNRSRPRSRTTTKHIRAGEVALPNYLLLFWCSTSFAPTTTTNTSFNRLVLSSSGNSLEACFHCAHSTISAYKRFFLVNAKSHPVAQL